MSIRTGFRRASIVMSVPFFALGIISFVLTLFAHNAAPPDPYDAYITDSPHFMTVLIGCILFGLGAVVFGAVRALGLVVGGFAQSDDAGHRSH
jgi:hypothetical protein